MAYISYRRLLFLTDKDYKKRLSESGVAASKETKEDSPVKAEEIEEIPNKVNTPHMHLY